jgi:hypothetical protein
MPNPRLTRENEGSCKITGVTKLMTRTTKCKRQHKSVMQSPRD